MFLIDQGTKQAKPSAEPARAKSGGEILPALVFGYDGQGYFYNTDTSTFAQREKGVFVAAGREILVPGMEATVGANIVDFKSNTVLAFNNISIDIENTLVFLIEYDNIHCTPDNRLNLGVQFAVADQLTIDMAGRCGAHR